MNELTKEEKDWLKEELAEKLQGMKERHPMAKAMYAMGKSLLEDETGEKAETDRAELERRFKRLDDCFKKETPIIEGILEKLQL